MVGGTDLLKIYRPVSETNHRSIQDNIMCLRLITLIHKPINMLIRIIVEVNGRHSEPASQCTN